MEEGAAEVEERRKLATVVRLETVQPHGNADRLALAKVRGWQVVIGKDEFFPGDLAIYCEIDSCIPESLLAGAQLEFLRQKRFIIKTIKLRGQLSQGILFPLGILERCALATGPEGHRLHQQPSDGTHWFGPQPGEGLHLTEGTNVTSVLGITKHEPVLFSIPQYNMKVRSFPLHLAPRTDEERVQNIVHLLQEWQGHEFYVTEKVDGSSFTCFLANDRFGVCSRNYEVVETEGNLFWGAAHKLDLEAKLRSLGRDPIVLQGELLGPQIQKNRYQLADHTIRFFTVYDPATKNDIPMGEAIALVQSLGLEWAPVIHPTFVLSAEHTVEALLAMAEAPSTLNSKVTREGLVFRSAHGKQHPGFGRISFKAISNAFLLKYDS